MKQKFKVTGMTCSACQAHVERDVSKVEGVDRVTVNLLSGSMYVEYRPEATNDNAIIKAVEEAGYGASVWAESEQPVAKKNNNQQAEELRNMKFRLIVSFACLIPMMLISMHHMFFHWIGQPVPAWLDAVLGGTENAMTYTFSQFLLLIPVWYVNRKFFITGFKRLFKGSPNMDTLIALGSAAAALYGIFAIFRIGYGLGHGDFELVDTYRQDIYFESSAMILTLITLGKFLETRSKGKTGEAISKLMDLAPQSAVVLRDGAEQIVPIEQVKVGDILVVKPGQNVPVDGTVTEGNGSVDQSALTGESIPVEKKPGDTVMASTINRNGRFFMRADKVGEDTTLSQIIRLVEEASNSKAPIAKLADKVSGIFVPVVIVIAVLAFVIWLLVGAEFEFALSMGISVLVISCPCALGLATPVAIMVGTGKGAEHGILIKSAESLERAHLIQTIVLDKTGTITEGNPVVTDIITDDSEETFLKLAASIEQASEHPLAEAVVREAKKRNIVLNTVSDFENTPGKGIRCRIGDQVYQAGNQSMLWECGIELGEMQQIGERLAEEGKTPLYFADETSVIGVIAVADIVKQDSYAAIAEMKRMNLEVVMLTGDNEKTATAISRDLPIDRVIAQVLPQDKEQEVRKLQEQGKVTAMVGDGINDAPALMRADVGIAIGAGADVAIESADIVLMKNSLLDVVAAIQLSRSVIRNIKMNLFWAFFYNSVGIPLAAGVFFAALGWRLNPMFGAAAMSLSSVCVVTNALRLKFFKPKLHGAVSQPKQRADTTDVISVDSQKEENTMTKVIKIEGMMCAHCKASAEKALKGIEGVTAAEADLANKQAVVELSADVADTVFQQVIEEAGFTFKGVE